VEESPRARIDLRLSTLLGIARRARLCVVVTSELSRAGYRKGQEQVAKISTFKESGGIEYLADQAFVFDKVDDSTFDVSVVKTRWGTVDSVVRLARGGWLTFTEQGIPETSGLGAEIRRVVDAVRKEGGFKGISGADACCRAAGMNMTKGRAAVRLAVLRGLLENVATKANGQPDEVRPRYRAKDVRSTSSPLKGTDEVDEVVPVVPDEVDDVDEVASGAART
jgi:hypothetical protein